MPCWIRADDLAALALWSDELYIVGKRFQPRLSELWSMLRDDTHPLLITRCSRGGGSWIGSPDFALLEETLARGLGLWPLPKLALLILLIWGLRRWGGMDGFRCLDRSPDLSYGRLLQCQSAAKVPR